MDMARFFVPLIVDAIRGQRPKIEKEGGGVRIFRIPQFNMIGKAFLPGNLPSVDEPDITDIPCQIYTDPRDNTVIDRTVNENYSPSQWIRYPIEYLSAGPIGIFQVPGGVERFYLVRHTVIMHEGFTNQYLAASVVCCLADGTPTNFPGGPAAAGDAIAGGAGEDPGSPFVPSGLAGSSAGGYSYYFEESEWTV